MSTLKRVLALSLALVMALSLSVFAVEFKDQDQIDDTCAEAIDMLVALNVLNAEGKGDGVFDPAGEIKRGEAAKMIYVLLNNGVDDLATLYTGRNTFGDVPAGSWYEGYIEYCYSLGIVAGRGTNTVTGKPTFDPEAPITGYELAKMLLVVGNYDPDIHQFTGDNWQSNVLKFANSTDLDDDYAVLMSAYAPRQWAALMMSNLIIKVEYARYLGDNLVTGSGMTYDGVTVGEQLLGLVTFTGTLTQTKNVNLGGGIDSYAYSTVNNVEYNPNFANINVNINFDAKADLLGQDVKVVAKAVNKSLTGTPLYAAKNLTVLSVYSTGKSAVYDLPLADITFAKTTTTNNNITTTTGVSIKLADYNGGKAVKFANADDINAFSDLFYNSEYEVNAPIAYLDPTTASGADIAAAVNAAFDSEGNYIGRTGVDAVRVIDTDGDGDINYILVKETEYKKVSNITSDRFVVSGLSAKLEDVIFDGAEAVKGDIVALTRVYESGDEQYVVRVIEPTTGVKVEKWSGSPAITNVVIDGTSYDRATDRYSEVTRTHSVYYLDGSVFVASAASTGDTSGTVDPDLAIIVDVGPRTDRTTSTGKLSGDVGFKAQHIGINGSRSTAAWYDFDNRTDSNAKEFYNNATAVWKDATDANALWAASVKFSLNLNAAGNPTTRAGAEANANRVNNEMKEFLGNGATPNFVLVNTNDDGSVWYQDAGATYVGSNTAAAYEQDKGKLTWGTNTLYVSADAKVFLSYGSTPSYKVVDGKDLKGFSTALGFKVAAYVGDENTGDAIALYLVGGTDLPTGTTKNYAVVTGSSAKETYGLNGTTIVDARAAVGKDGAFDLMVPKGSGSSLVRWAVYSYETKTANHDVTLIDFTAAANKMGNISNVNYDDGYVVLGGQRFYYDENTTILEVNNTAGTARALTEPYATSGPNDVGLVLTTSGEIDLIVINGDGNSVENQHQGYKLSMNLTQNTVNQPFNNFNLGYTGTAPADSTYTWTAVDKNGVSKAPTGFTASTTGYTVAAETTNWNAGDKITLKVSKTGYNDTTFTWELDKATGIPAGAVAITDTDLDVDQTSDFGLTFTVDLTGVTPANPGTATYVWGTDAVNGGDTEDFYAAATACTSSVFTYTCTDDTEAAALHGVKVSVVVTYSNYDTAFASVESSAIVDADN